MAPVLEVVHTCPSVQSVTSVLEAPFELQRRTVPPSQNCAFAVQTRSAQTPSTQTRLVPQFESVRHVVAVLGSRQTGGASGVQISGLRQSVTRTPRCPQELNW
jgi:hypothetical protein